MQRIDSPNARPNINGEGKQGFHDNADLSGQDATYLTPEWCNHVQEEIANAIEVFEPLQNKKDQLAGTFQRLIQRIEVLEGRIIEETKVGDIFLTMQSFNTSDEVHQHKGYGSWEKVGNGHALVTQGLDDSRPEFMRSIGNVGGEDSHQLTTNELPEHKHSNSDIYNKFSAIAIDVHNTGYSGDGDGLTIASSDDIGLDSQLQVDEISNEQREIMTEKAIGSNTVHNNIQLSLVIGAWRRTA